MIYLKLGQSGVSNVQSTPINLASGTAAATVTLTEIGTTGIYKGTPTAAAGEYALSFSAAGNPVDTESDIYYWDGTQEITRQTTNALTKALSDRATELRLAKLDGNITPDNAGIAKLTALLTVDNSKFTSTALSNAPTGSGGGLLADERSYLLGIPQNPLLVTGYTAPDNTAIVAAKTAAEAVNTKLTTTRVANLDNVSQFNAASDLVGINKVGSVTVTTPNDFKADVTTIGAQTGVLRGLVNAGGTAYTVAALANAPTGSGGGGLLSDERSHLLAIPQNPLLATAYTAPDNTSIVAAKTAAEAVNTKLTTTRAANLDNVSQFNPASDLVAINKVGTVSVTSPNDFKADVGAIGNQVSVLSGLVDTGDRFKASALVNAPTSFIQADRDRLFAIPTTAAPSTTAVANAVQLALTAKLDAIAADALLGALPVGNSEIDPITAECVYTRNGAEVLRVRQQDETGALNPVRVFKTTVV